MHPAYYTRHQHEAFLLTAEQAHQYEAFLFTTSRRLSSLPALRLDQEVIP